MDARNAIDARSVVYVDTAGRCCVFRGGLRSRWEGGGGVPKYLVGGVGRTAADRTAFSLGLAYCYRQDALRGWNAVGGEILPLTCSRLLVSKPHSHPKSKSVRERASHLLPLRSTKINKVAPPSEGAITPLSFYYPSVPKSICDLPPPAATRLLPTVLSVFGFKMLVAMVSVP